MEFKPTNPAPERTPEQEDQLMAQYAHGAAYAKGMRGVCYCVLALRNYLDMMRPLVSDYKTTPALLREYWETLADGSDESVDAVFSALDLMDPDFLDTLGEVEALGPLYREDI